MFVHYTDIDDDVKLLLPSIRVDFDCYFDDNGPVAINVKKVIPKRKTVCGIDRWTHYCRSPWKSGWKSQRASTHSCRRRRK